MLRRRRGVVGCSVKDLALFPCVMATLLFGIATSPLPQGCVCRLPPDMAATAPWTRRVSPSHHRPSAGAMATDALTQRIHDTLSRVLLVSLTGPAKGAAHLPALALVRALLRPSCLSSPVVHPAPNAQRLTHHVSHQELAAEGKAVVVDHRNQTAERALFAVLQAVPLDVAPSPFQYLLGCVCHPSSRRGQQQLQRGPPGHGVRLTPCVSLLLSPGATAAPLTRPAAWAHATAMSAPWSASR